MPRQHLGVVLGCPLPSSGGSLCRTPPARVLPHITGEAVPGDARASEGQSRQDPSNHPKQPCGPQPHPARRGEGLLHPCVAGLGRQQRLGAGDMLAVGVLAPSSPSPALPVQKPPHLRSSLPSPGRAARGNRDAPHIQAVICSPGKAPPRGGDGRGALYQQAHPGLGQPGSAGCGRSQLPRPGTRLLPSAPSVSVPVLHGMKY